jgi:amidase
MRLRFEEFFADWDVLLLPVMPVPAIPHDHSEPIAGRTGLISGRSVAYWDLATWMAPAGACYLPATVVPVGLTPAGLPVGIQIVGPYLNDRTTLAVAALLETLLGGCPSPPGF